MPNGAYLYYKALPCNNRESILLDGVDRKVIAQIDTLASLGSCSLYIVDYSAKTLGRKIRRRLPFVSDGIDWDSHIDQLGGVDYLYIRRPDYFSGGFISFLKMVKARNPRCLILLELPTNPYDEEYENWKSYPVLMKDRFHRKRIKEYIDRIVDLSGKEPVFGIPVLPVTNGLDLSAVSPRNPISDPNSLNIICVASFEKWHGVDRMIDGINIYLKRGCSQKKNRKITFHLIGDGSALKQIKRKVREEKIESSIVFHGRCNRQQMDEIYDHCSFAVECLGLHRKGLSLSSSLKSREYLAKGIPFVYSGEIDVFVQHPVDFCMQVSADDSAIDICELVKFHDRLYEEKREIEIVGEIRKYAEDHVGMKHAMKNVIDYVQKNHKRNGEEK